MTVTERIGRGEVKPLTRNRLVPGPRTREPPAPRRRKVKRVVLIVLGVLGR
jgi:hypothetical protein